jgi:hypothetical protein
MGCKGSADADAGNGGVGEAFLRWSVLQQWELQS